MKAPRFEELARRWAGKAEIFYVFSEEAHPHAENAQRLEMFASRVQSLDRDHDGTVTPAEYAAMGPMAPQSMFDAFDVDHDGVIRSYELLAARRVSQFSTVEEPKTIEARIALAKRFRAEVPGSIRILIDGIDNRTSAAYGSLPNSVFVIEHGGRVSMKRAWAASRDVDVELARLTGAPPPAPEPPPDLAPIAATLAAAKASGKRVLVDFVAPGCEACAKMDATTLADLSVRDAMNGYEVVRLGVERDDAWRLFESLDLAATPGFAILAPDGGVIDRRQGYQDRDHFVSFLSR
ncbi:MAG TPA: thioredoxin family protein [Kofleriaceae bacterium]|nr:thioredoxin family protein [Kofleriaceae bacterium]